MKSLQILPSLQLGGVERGVIDLARAVKRRGEEIVVISSGGELVNELKKMGVTHYELPVHKKSLFSLSLVPKIAEIIRRERIDIVHARSRVPGWLAWLACRRTGVPFITTCHGYYSTHLLSAIMGWGKKVIVISRIIGRHMIDHFGVSPDRIRLIHRGVDLAQFSFREPRKGPCKTFRIINIGRLSPIKGQLEFIKAIHVLKKQIPAIEVLIVGSEGKGKHKYTEQLKQTIRQLGLDSTVQLLGTRRDISDLLATSDLLVLSTLVPEAFGRVAIEAGAVGVPVLATRVGGVLDIIEDQENGILVPPGDSEAMGQAMADLLNQPEQAQVFVKKLRAKIEKEFTLEQMVEKTLAVYQEAIEEKKILMIKLGAMGDVVLSIPSIRMIRHRYPQAFISVLVDRKWASLLSSSPYLDEVIPVDRLKLSQLPYLFKFAKKIRREHFDVSVDLQNSKWTHILSFFGGVKERYGFSRGKFGFLLNHGDASHAVTESPIKHQYRILLKLGVRDFDETLELWEDPAVEAQVDEMLQAKEGGFGKKWVGLVVGSSAKWPTKRWPIESFLKLSERLIQTKNCRLVFLGSQEDRLLINGLLPADNLDYIDLVGKTSIPELISVMKRLDVLISGDTAPLHIASAAQTKIVALFGPTDPKKHLPPGNHHVVLMHHLPCQPCYRGECHNAEKLACMKQISVEEVLHAVDRLWIREKV